MWLQSVWNVQSVVEELNIYLCVCMCVCVCVCVCLSLSPVWLLVTPMDCRPPGSSVHGILQTRILECVAFYFSRESSQPRDQTQVSSCIAGRFFTNWATREAQEDEWKLYFMLIDLSLCFNSQTWPVATTLDNTAPGSLACMGTGEWKLTWVQAWVVKLPDCIREVKSLPRWC